MEEMGCVHGEEDCVGGSHFLVLGLGRDRHPGCGLGNLDHNHSLVRRDDVRPESHGHSIQGEVSEIASGGGIYQGEISQPHDNHCRCDHVILLVSHPNHFGHLELDSGPRIAVVAVGVPLRPSLEVPGYP